jgi:hypothetical protein
MRRISLEQTPSKLPVNTFLTYGNTRTGKTTFGATFPRPYIIADPTEGGFRSILNMDRTTWFESDVEPIIVGVENMNDIATVISDEIRELVARKRILTIVFDAFSYYTDFFLAALVRMDAKLDNRQAYGRLGTHLREVRLSMHSHGINVVWNCLAKHPDTDNPVGGPLIPGQQGDKFGAGVDFLWHSRVEQIRAGEVIKSETYEMRTRLWRGYLCGHREGIYAGQLPDPFVGTYSDLVPLLGYDLEQVKANMPKIQAASATAKATVIEKPPAASPPKPVIVTRGAAPGAKAPTPIQPKTATPPSQANGSVGAVKSVSNK